MALAGAWVRTVLGANYVVFEGRTFAADGDTAVLGLDGDAGADTGLTLPAGWPTVGQADETVGVVSDVDLHSRTKVLVVPLTDPSVGVGGSCSFGVIPGSAPFQKTIHLGATPAVAITARVEVQYINSMIR